MLILLPPSEGKSAEAGEGRFRDLNPDVVEDTERVVAKLRRLKVADRMKAYGQKDREKAAAIHAMNLGVVDAPCLKAIERYTGVVYGHIDYGTLKSKRRADTGIAIVSGMFGAIRAATPIPNYKLPLSRALADYWRPINDERISDWAENKPILSLLPTAHQRAVGIADPIHVDFRTQGGKRSAGHGGKAIKGRFVRFLIENDIQSPDGFDGFEEEGYRFDGTDFIQP